MENTDFVAVEGEGEKVTSIKPGVAYVKEDESVKYNNIAFKFYVDFFYNNELKSTVMYRLKPVLTFGDLKEEADKVFDALGIDECNRAYDDSEIRENDNVGYTENVENPLESTYEFSEEAAGQRFKFVLVYMPYEDPQD